MIPLDKSIAREAKAITVLAFRNGPLEQLHQGKMCPHCYGKPEYLRVSTPDLTVLMKSAVDAVYRLLMLRTFYPKKYEGELTYSEVFTKNWDDPNPDLEAWRKRVLYPEHLPPSDLEQERHGPSQ